MTQEDDRPGVIVHPPIAWALAVVAGLALRRVYPVRFVPDPIPKKSVGWSVFAAGFGLGLWAALTIKRAGSQVATNQATTRIVTRGPFRYSRNPIYLGMFLGQAGLAVGFDNAWLLVALAPFYLVIRHGVVAREERYLARKFGDGYLAYKRLVRRWL